MRCSTRVVKFRAKKGRVAAQIHGNTRLEITWTVGAALILVVLAAVTFAKLGSIQNPPNSGANGLQLAQGVRPDRLDDGADTAGRQEADDLRHGPPVHLALHVRRGLQVQRVRACPTPTRRWSCPANTTVVLDIEATDVIHSWWIPKLGGKFDAVPGYRNYTWFKAPHAGALYKGQCAELCGRNHADMTARVRVVSPADYQTWLDAQKRRIAAANRQARRAARAAHARRRPLAPHPSRQRNPNRSWPPPTTHCAQCPR